MSPSVIAVALILFITSFVPPAAAQTTGTLSGSVQDTTGAVLPGVTVSATNEATGSCAAP
jgi:hypothetical protein